MYLKNWYIEWKGIKARKRLSENEKAFYFSVGVFVLHGNVFESERFPDGLKIHTSLLKKLELSDGLIYASTQNSIYELHDDDMSTNAIFSDFEDATQLIGDNIPKEYVESLKEKHQRKNSEYSDNN